MSDCLGDFIIVALKVESSAEIFSLLSALPSQLDDVDLLLHTADHLCQDSVDADVVEGLRRSVMFKFY